MTNDQRKIHSTPHDHMNISELRIDGSRWIFGKFETRQLFILATIHVHTCQYLCQGQGVILIPVDLKRDNMYANHMLRDVVVLL